jgi:hypothetical protein
MSQSGALDQSRPGPCAYEPLGPLERHLRVVGIMEDEADRIDVLREVLAA